MSAIRTTASMAIPIDAAYNSPFTPPFSVVAPNTPDNSEPSSVFAITPNATMEMGLIVMSPNSSWMLNSTAMASSTSPSTAFTNLATSSLVILAQASLMVCLMPSAIFVSVPSSASTVTTLKPPLIRFPMIPPIVLQGMLFMALPRKREILSPMMLHSESFVGMAL